MSEPAAGRTAPSRAELVGLTLLVLATLLYWSAQYRPFTLPNNDYASFANTAAKFAEGALPRGFQRGPLLPALMALLGPLMPEPHPHLHAALVLNIAFSLGTLVLLYLFARPLLGAGALLVPTLFAATSQFHSMGLQPLVEPSLGFFVVLAFVLFQRGSAWQYAAAGLAALSRNETAVLFPVLFLSNWASDRRLLRHAALAALGGVPMFAWLALGASRRSAGGNFYTSFADEMGFTPAPQFLRTCLKEPFRGWFTDEPGIGMLGFALAVGLPLLAGVVTACRRFPREAFALLGTWLGCVTLIVGFGIDKGRYVYPTQWITLFFFAAGLLVLARWAARRLDALPVAVLRGLAGSGALGWLLVLRGGGLRLAAQFHVHPLALDFAFAVVLLALCAAALPRGARGASHVPSRAAATAAGVLALISMTPVVFGGLKSFVSDQHKIYFGNHGITLASAWLAEHLPPGEGALVIHEKHYRFLVPEPDRFVGMHRLRAVGAQELAAEMRERGLTHLVATWRKPVRQPSDEVYERQFKWYLLDPFTAGAPVPGFELVATLPQPEHLKKPPVQIYRLLHRTFLAPPGRDG